MKSMPKRKLRKIALIIAGIVTVLAILNQALAQTSSNSQIKTPRGLVNLKNVPFSQVFPIYTNLCHSINIKVDADKSVTSLSKPVTVQTPHPVTASELIGLLENVFEKQAGVDVIHSSTDQVILRLQ